MPTILFWYFFINLITCIIYLFYNSFITGDWSVTFMIAIIAGIIYVFYEESKHAKRMYMEGFEKGKEEGFSKGFEEGANKGAKAVIDIIIKNKKNCKEGKANE